MSKFSDFMTAQLQGYVDSSVDLEESNLLREPEAGLPAAEIIKCIAGIGVEELLKREPSLNNIAEMMIRSAAVAFEVGFEVSRRWSEVEALDAEHAT